MLTIFFELLELLIQYIIFARKDIRKVIQFVYHFKTLVLLWAIPLEWNNQDLCCLCTSHRVYWQFTFCKEKGWWQFRNMFCFCWGNSCHCQYSFCKEKKKMNIDSKHKSCLLFFYNKKYDIDQKLKNKINKISDTLFCILFHVCKEKNFPHFHVIL